MTYQEPWAISHPNLIFSHAGEHWFYGLSSTRALSYDELKRARPPDKPKLISTVCSSKRQRHTLHAVPTDTLLSSLAFIRQRNKGAFSGGSRRAEGMSTEVQCALTKGHGLFLKRSGVLTTKDPARARARNPTGFEQEATERTEGCIALLSPLPPVQTMCQKNTVLTGSSTKSTKFNKFDCFGHS